MMAIMLQTAPNVQLIAAVNGGIMSVLIPILTENIMAMLELIQLESPGIFGRIVTI